MWFRMTLGGLIMSHFCLVDRIMLSLCVSPVMTPESGVLSPGLLGSNYQVSAVSGNVAILAILAIHGKARPSHEKQPGHQHRPWAASSLGSQPGLGPGPGPASLGQPQVCGQNPGWGSGTVTVGSILSISPCHSMTLREHYTYHKMSIAIHDNNTQSSFLWSFIFAPPSCLSYITQTCLLVSSKRLSGGCIIEISYLI